MGIQIGGIASGLDTNQMIKDLMRAERIKVDKYYRQEEAIKWQQEALNTTNKTLAEFILKARSGFGLTSTTGTGTIVNKSTDSFDWVKKVTSSNESVIKATASANAMEGTYNVDVKQLAEVASFTSGDINKLLNNGVFTTSGNFEIEVGSGKKVTINVEENKTTITELVKQINDAVDSEDKSLGLRAAYDSSLGKLMINTKEQGKEQSIVIGGDLASKMVNSTYELNLEDLGDNITYKYEGLETSLDLSGSNNDEKKDKIIASINGLNLGDKVKAEFKDGKLIIQATMDSGFILTKNGTSDIIPKEYNNVGKNAEVTFNGETIEQSQNNFTMFGVNYQLQSVGKSTINVESNVDGIMDKVKNFVEEYNTLIDNLNGMLKEKSYRDYKPLTKEEKEAMSEKEIELWEERAKSGLLKNDPSITRMLQSMRSGLYENVHDNWTSGMGKDESKLSGFSHITQIGITTGNYQSGGRLEINEEKLRKAIVDNPDGVINLLFKKSDKKVPELGKNPTQDEIEARNNALAEKRANSGLVERIFDDMITNMKDIVRRSGTGKDASLYRSVQSNMLIDFVTNQGSISVLDKDLTSVGSRIAREERTLTSREQRYWSKFTAMEKALQSMNSQSSWLASQLGQM